MAPVYLKYADYGIMINPCTAEPPILREISIIDIYVYICIYIIYECIYIYNIYAYMHANSIAVTEELIEMIRLQNENEIWMIYKFFRLTL